MRIGVLEWASCFGRESLGNGLPETLRVEGWAMCRAALRSLIAAGYQAVAAVDATLTSDPLLECYRPEQLQLFKTTSWESTYAACDATLVIAPESDGILAGILGACERAAITTCNAHGGFLATASDKLATAQAWQRASVAHPPTSSLADAQDFSKQPGLWVVKRRSGAGCEGMRRLNSAQCNAFRSEQVATASAADWIVQPWLEGRAYSRAAIFDHNGVAHWLPVTSQDLATSSVIRYRGGTVHPGFDQKIPGLQSVLLRAGESLGFGRLGWVGFDFLVHGEPHISNLHRPSAHRSCNSPRNPISASSHSDVGEQGSYGRALTVIEVNPRLTTSFVGLSAAGAPDLAGAIVAACLGGPIALPESWQAVQFTAAGEIQSD